ncbi:MAG: trypsin-like peptidase domain-containing protein [Planctomycetaceae bacterium]
MNVIRMFIAAASIVAVASNPAVVAAADSPEILLLDFTASYCPPCQQMLPIIQRMEKDGYPIKKIDISENSQLSRQYKVDLIPTFVLLVEGREVKRFVGLTSEEELRREMRKERDRVMAERGESRPPESVSVESELQEARVSTPDAPAIASKENDGRSLGNLFRGMFRRDKESAFEFPTVRAQDAPIDGLPDGVTRAAAATVRIHVTSEKLQDVGTGTIVYSVPGQSLVLTCAHLFAGQSPSARIEVNLFRDGQESRYPAKLIGGSHDSDLAFVRVQNADILPSVALSAQPVPVEPGQPAVSFGCDNGRAPTLLRTEVLKLNPYTGPANLTCRVDPVQGRSGGGLFDLEGHLLAVCSCADRDNKEGLYMAQAAINDLVRTQKIEYVLQSSPGSAGEDVAEAFAAAQQEAIRQVTPAGRTERPLEDPFATAMSSSQMRDGDVSSTSPDGMDSPVNTPVFTEVPDSAADLAGSDFSGGAAAGTDSLADSGLANPFRANGGLSESLTSVLPTSATTEMTRDSAGNSSAVSATSAPRGTRITVLIDGSGPGAAQRMVVIPNATPWLLELLTGEPPSEVSRIQPTSDRQARK